MKIFENHLQSTLTSDKAVLESERMPLLPLKQLFTEPLRGDLVTARLRHTAFIVGSIQVFCCSQGTSHSAENVNVMHIIPLILKPVCGWCTGESSWVLCVPPRQEQTKWLRFGPSTAGWLQSLSTSWCRSKMICRLWAGKLALDMDQWLPSIGGSEEQMSGKPLAQLLQAAPGQAEERLPSSSVCGIGSAIQWGHPSVALCFSPLPAGSCSRHSALAGPGPLALPG